MNGKDWNTFVVTGRVADYLNYRNAYDGLLEKDCDMNQTGAKKRESDRSDGNGAVGSTHR